MQKRSKHIVIITGQHMTANPRVWKEANTLFNFGYKVTILSTLYDSDRLKEDQKLLHPEISYKAAVNLIPGSGSFIRRVIPKVLRRIAILKKTYLGKDSTHLIAYNPGKLFKQALAENGDLYIAHQETGLIIGCALIKHDKKVAFDFEDWYSKDYINLLRPVKLLSEAEAFALMNGVYCSCPSESMSAALFNTYRIDKRPYVLYNGFSIKENSINTFEKRKPRSLIWFSQVIGEGRGLETLLEAMCYIEEPLELNLIGQVDVTFEKIIREKLMNTNHRVFFHGVVKHKDLVGFISKYVIGLALESNETPSRDTTITNKILQYLQAGNKIIATKTQGQIELSDTLPGFIHLVNMNKPNEWAKEIELLMNSDKDNTKHQLKKFKEKFSWEAQEDKLLSLVRNVVEQK